MSIEQSTTPAIILTLENGFILKRLVVQAIDNETVRVWPENEPLNQTYLTRGQLIQMIRTMDGAPAKQQSNDWY
jgi:hypothetical protein